MSLPQYPKYKNSGVEWLGSMPETWTTRRMKTLFEIRKRIAGQEGFDVLSITQKGLKVKDIDSNDGQLAMDYSNYQFVEPGDFAMNHMDLLTGWVDIASASGVTSPDYRVFSTRSPGTIHDRYYLYLFQNAYKQRIFYAFGQGASQLGRWRLPTEQFNDFVVPFPPITEQVAISNFLESELVKIDALVEEQRRLIELLKEKRQAVISHAVTKGLNPGAPMKPSGIDWLGDVPASWAVGRLSDVCISIDTGPFGTSLKSDDYIDDGTPVINPSHIVDSRIVPESKVTVSEETAEKLSRWRLIQGDLVVARRGEVGRAALVLEANHSWICGTGSLRVRPFCDKILGSYVAIVLQSGFARQWLELASVGSTMFNLNERILGALPMVFPRSLEEQRETIEQMNLELGKVDTLIAEANGAIGLLHERRSALISAAVTGKIDVRASVTECVA